MQCPACSARMSSRTVKGRIEVDTCPACRGTWFDGGELCSFAPSSSTVEAKLVRLTLNAAEGDRHCPRCDLPMSVGPFAGTEIEIDVCGGCEGVWLDAGETKAVLAAVAALPPEQKREIEASALPPPRTRRRASRSAAPVEQGPNWAVRLFDWIVERLGPPKGDCPYCGQALEYHAGFTPNGDAGWGRGLVDTRRCFICRSCSKLIPLDEAL